MSALEVFQYAGVAVRTVTIDGEPWFVLADLCAVLDIANPRNVAARLYDEMKGVHSMDTLGGRQNVTVVNESGMYEVVIRSDKPEAAAFRRWITGTVLPTIRKTGSYGAPAVPDLTTPEGVLALAEQFTATARELVAVTERAKVAEQFKTHIERNEGLVPRAFHKHYFPEVTEKAFFDLLYRRGLLIDRRGKGTQRADGTWRDGSQHGHPGYQGKQFFYIDTGVNPKTGYRYEQTRVRPGEPEVALVQHLTKLGLAPQTSSKELASV